MKTKAVCVCCFFSAVVVAGPSPTASKDAEAAIAKATTAVQKKEWAAASSSLAAALAIARNEAPLVVTQAAIVTAPHVGLGVYTPVSEVKGSDLKLYVELDNVGARALPDGRQELVVEVVGTFSALKADGSLEKKLGRVPLGEQSVQTWRTTGVHSLGLDVRMGDAPRGKYAVELEVFDKVAGKSAKKTVPFALIP